jgi:hypothetical protein
VVSLWTAFASIVQHARTWHKRVAVGSNFKSQSTSCYEDTTLLYSRYRKVSGRFSNRNRPVTRPYPTKKQILYGSRLPIAQIQSPGSPAANPIAAKAPETKPLRLSSCGDRPVSSSSMLEPALPRPSTFLICSEINVAGTPLTIFFPALFMKRFV